MNAKWITPVVTAFDAEGHVDLEANKRIYSTRYSELGWLQQCHFYGRKEKTD